MKLPNNERSVTISADEQRQLAAQLNLSASFAVDVAYSGLVYERKVEADAWNMIGFYNDLTGVDVFERITIGRQ